MNETTEHNPDGLTPEQYGAPEWRLLRVGEIPKRGDGISYAISPAKWEPIDSDFRCAIGPYAPCTFRRRVSPTLADQSAQLAEREVISENKGGDEPCAQQAQTSQSSDHLKQRKSSESGNVSASNAPVAVQSGDQGQSARIAELERQLLIERGEVEAGDRVLKDQDEEIAELKRRVEELTEERDRLRRENEEMEGALESDRKALANVIAENDTLRAEVERLTKERDVYRGDVVRISTQANALGSRAEKAEQERDNLRAQLAEREEDRAKFEKVLMDALDIVTGHADPMPSLWKVEEHLRAAIRAARAQEDGK